MKAKYDGVVLHADVLGQPDRGDRVEVALLDVAVVHVPDLGEVVEPLLLDPLLRPRRLLAREGDAERVHAVLAGGVADHAAPAAAEVEQPLARLQVELAGDEVVLLELRLLERRGLGREDRAGVGHRGAEDQLVEAVGDVVVVVDRLGVAAERVPQPLDGAAQPGRRLLRRRGRRAQLGEPDRAQQLDRLAGEGRLKPRLLWTSLSAVVGVAGVHAGELEVAGDVGAAEAEVARRGEDVAEPALVEERQAVRRVLGAARAPVVRREAEGQRGLEQRVERLGDGEGGAGHRSRTALS